MAGVKKRPFKTAFYPLAYLVRDIYGFYNRPSPQYEIGGKNIINDYGPVISRGYFNFDIINICPRGATASIKYYISYHGFPKAIINITYNTCIYSHETF